MRYYRSKECIDYLIKTLNIAQLLSLMKVPKGAEMFSPACGIVSLVEIKQDEPCIVVASSNGLVSFFSDGKLYPDGEVMLFPDSKEKRWSQYRYFQISPDIIDFYEDIATFVNTIKLHQFDVNKNREVESSLRCQYENLEDIKEERIARKRNKNFLGFCPPLRPKEMRLCTIIQVLNELVLYYNSHSKYDGIYGLYPQKKRRYEYRHKCGGKKFYDYIWEVKTISDGDVAPFVFYNKKTADTFVDKYLFLLCIYSRYVYHTPNMDYETEHPFDFEIRPDY